MKAHECQLNARIPKQYYEQIKKIAHDSDISVSGFIRAIVQYCIDKKVRLSFEPTICGTPMKKNAASLRRDACKE